MGKHFLHWEPKSSELPQNYSELRRLILKNREFQAVDKLEYGDHGLSDVLNVILKAIKENKRIALYSDYDVDGTMSCVSWIWFFKEIKFENFIPYIPCRFKEGYGLNLKAVKHLIDSEKVDLIITMDTGITANEEAAYCKSQGVDFVCTDHHLIQTNKMPDCFILNPKQHPDPIYQELCGCGITFVLLRKLAENFTLSSHIWSDLLALAGMSTICDVVPLNGVNHRLARLGVKALMNSKRPVLKQLLQASANSGTIDESDIGYKLGPRINAVGRLEHAEKVVQAFIDEDPSELIYFMNECNERRRTLQYSVHQEALEQVKTQLENPLFFLGGDWHPGVLGIVAGKLAQEFWRPVYLFQKKEGLCKGSARSIPGFNVTDAMGKAETYFDKFGGHHIAAGYTFKENVEDKIQKKLLEFAAHYKKENPNLWESRIHYDCTLPTELLSLELAESLQDLRPFGNSFEEPKFKVEGTLESIEYYKDKVTRLPKHSALFVKMANGAIHKILFFNTLFEGFIKENNIEAIVTASKNRYKGNTTLSLIGQDLAIK